MTKRKYDVSVTILALLVALVPIFGAAGDKKSVIYTSLCALLVALGYRIYKGSGVRITKTALIFLGLGVFFALELLWVSDKGSQASYSAMFFSGALVSVIISDVKADVGEDRFKEGVLSVGYVVSAIYAVCVLLFQVFIESDFLFGAMDMGNGTATATAIIMLLGMVAALKLFKGREKTAFYYPALILMGVVFVMTGSLTGYLAAGVIALYYTVEIRKKRAWTMAVLVFMAIVGILTVIYGAFLIIMGNANPDGAFRGLVNIIGIGKGGYEASVAILAKDYIGYTPVFFELIEAAGIFGMVITGFAVFLGYKKLEEKRSEASIAAFCAMICVLLTGSSALCYMIIIISILYTLTESGTFIKFNKNWAIGLVVPLMFFALPSFSGVFSYVAQDRADYEKYADAAKLYEISAKCAIFDSEDWEKAYLCGMKACENGEDMIAKCNEYVENAMKFNKKNYLYRQYLADVYMASGNEEKSVEVWNGIMTRYDKEVLYVPYVTALSNMMEKGECDLYTMESLYNTIGEYAQKATDSKIKLQVNNILTQSQTYYIEKREGKVEEYEEIIPEEDVFVQENPTETVTEEI